MMEDPYQNHNSLEYKFRLKRFNQVRSLIRSVLATKQSCRILDVGGTETYWDIGRDLVNSGRLKIDLLNLTTCEVRDENFRSLAGDARDLPDLASHSYDLCHSNSVIEHVGDWKDMMAMAQEVRRLAPNYFVQVPYFWFPLEPHFRVPFFHWFPEQIRYRLLLKRKLGFHKKEENVGDAVAMIQSAKLLDRRQFAALFPDAHIISEKVAFLTKSLMAIRIENDVSGALSR
jgi:hypothetical protein